MVSIFTAIKEEMADSNLGEESEQIQVQSRRPELGQTITMGGDRKWQVVKVEAYKSEGKTVYVAMVAPEKEMSSLPDESEWSATYMRQDAHSMAFYVNLSEEDQVINYGWDYAGVPPSGRLLNYEPVEGYGSLMKPIPSQWVISTVDECQPEQQEPTFDMVYLCRCQKEVLAA